MTDKDLDALREGLTSPFWALFTAHASKEWGPSGLRFQQAVRDAAKSQDAVFELQKVIAQQEAVLALLQWPHERVELAKQQALSALAAVSSGSRRGPGL
jgi:hypothetical protein